MSEVFYRKLEEGEVIQKGDVYFDKYDTTKLLPVDHYVYVLLDVHLPHFRPYTAAEIVKEYGGEEADRIHQILKATTEDTDNRIGELLNQVDALKSELESLKKPVQWIGIKDKVPTESDADKHGNIIQCLTDNVCIDKWDSLVGCVGWLPTSTLPKYTEPEKAKLPSLAKWINAEWKNAQLGDPNWTTEDIYKWHATKGMEYQQLLQKEQGGE